VKDALTAVVTKAPKGTWIDGWIGQTVLENSQATGAALDAVAPDYPVMLLVWTGHSALLNTAAMRKIGVREDEPDPQGGRYVRNKADGMFTGLVLEYAAWGLFRRWSELASEQTAVKDLHKYFDNAVRMGITTVQDMAMPIFLKNFRLRFVCESFARR
jgi:predicted amidohydrolase YtcJ